MNTQENKGPPGAGLRRYRHFFPKGTQTCYRYLCENPQNDRGFRRLKVEIRDYSFLALESKRPGREDAGGPQVLWKWQETCVPALLGQAAAKDPTGTDRHSAGRRVPEMRRRATGGSDARARASSGDL